MFDSCNDFEGGLRDVTLGVFLLVAMFAIAIWTFIGAYVFAAWVWGLV